MNAEYESFEERLRKTKLAAPSPELMARLLNTLPAAARTAPAAKVGAGRPVNLARILLRYAVPLAAAIVIAAGLALHVSNRRRPDMTAAPAKSAGSPVRSMGWLLGARELGMVRAADGRPYRVVQGVELGLEVYEDPVTGIVTERAAPRQRVLLVSMNSM